MAELKSSSLTTNDVAPSSSSALGHDAPPSDAALLAHVQSVWDRIKPNSAIYGILLADVRLVSATAGRVVAHLDLAPVHLNSKRIVHGSVSATIVDWAGGLAIASTGLDKTGVSTDIHISYVAPAKEGDTLEIVAWVSRVGKSLGYTMIEIRKAGENGSKGPVVCTGSHTKYLNI